MNAPARATTFHSPEHDAAIRATLKGSVYPGATDASIEKVIAYCKAANLDPMSKPVHIISQWVREHFDGGRKVPAGMQDIVLPGIGAYRTLAHRTGEYAGHDEPEFGPSVSRDLGGFTVDFPQWCRVTVYRMNGSFRAAYSARIYWLETYATPDADSDVPDVMWRKRPYGQLEKCAEALALRKAFPEAIGALPAAEEMDGRHAAIPSAAPAAPVIEMPRAKAAAEPANDPAPMKLDPADKVEAGIHVSATKKKLLLAKARAAGLDESGLLLRHSAIHDSNYKAVMDDLFQLANGEA